MNASGAARVHVIGGTGTMGKRVVSLLRESLPSQQVVVASRRSSVRVDVAAPERLELGAGDVVVDAVGPYRHDPRALVRHCLRNGAHYVDLSESVDFHELVVQALVDHERVAPATSAIVPGCSTVPALVDGLMADRAGSSRTVLLSVGSRNEASAPLLYGFLRPLGLAHAGGRWWGETTTRVLLDGSHRRYGSHPAPWPDRSTYFFCGVDIGIAYWMLRAASLATSRLSDDRLASLCRALVPVANVAGVFGSPAGSLRLERWVGSTSVEVVEVRANDKGLMIPALPAVWAALNLLGRNDAVGRLSLSDLMDEPSLVAELRARGYIVESVTVGLFSGGGHRADL